MTITEEDRCPLNGDAPTPGGHVWYRMGSHMHHAEYCARCDAIRHVVGAESPCPKANTVPVPWGRRT